jgi:hypothetical protein
MYLLKRSLPILQEMPGSILKRFNLGIASEYQAQHTIMNSKKKAKKYYDV